MSQIYHGTSKTCMNTAFLHDGTEKCAVVTKSVLWLNSIKSSIYKGLRYQWHACTLSRFFQKPFYIEKYIIIIYIITN